MTRRVLSLLALLALGCTNNPEVEAAALPGELAQAYCGAIDTCAGALGEIFVGSDCVGTFEPAFRNTILAGIDRALVAGTANYDGAAAHDCLEAYRDLGCEVFSAAAPAACRDVLIGTIELGSPCSDDGECAGDAYCDGAMCPESSGTCATRKANGASCEDDDECQAGLTCEGGTCGPPSSRLGGPCEGPDGIECVLGELCRGGSETETGTCEPFDSALTAGLGDPCQLNEEAAGGQVLCEAGLSCAVTGFAGTSPTFECVEGVGADADCNVAIPEMCPTGQFCDANPMALMFEGTCMPLPTQGQPCAAVQFGARCAPLHVCASTDVCVRPQDNGATCTVDEECHSDSCREDGVCGLPDACTL